jgi:hypothetical protein
MRTLFFLMVLFQFHASSFGQKQGIQGQVFWLSGNQMPGPEKAVTPQQGIVREIHVYNAVTLANTQRQDGFFQNIDAVLVTKVSTNPDGSFRIKLPPGKYSLFTKEEKGLFANLYDGNGCINCISVKPRKYSWITITVYYEAAY